MDKTTKICPFCKEEILKDAVKCRYCHEWLDGRKTPLAAAVPKNLNTPTPRTPNDS